MVRRLVPPTDRFGGRGEGPLAILRIESLIYPRDSVYAMIYSTCVPVILSHIPRDVDVDAVLDTSNLRILET